MTPEQLDDIEARADAATEGPWERGDVWGWAGVMPEMFAADTEFVAHARTDVPALVAEVRRLRAIVDAVDKLHEPTGTHLVAEIDGLGGEQREIEPDSFEEITSREVVCMACAGYPEAPCPTRQAIDAHERTTA